MKAQFELMPFKSAEEELTSFSEGTDIAVTTSPQLGVDRTVEFSEIVEKNGLNPVPHIASRYVRDEEHAVEIFDKLSDSGIQNVFVPAGDLEEPEGPFDSSYKLLKFVDEKGYKFDKVGITGYPEGHEFISDDELWRSLKQKSEYANYIITQICFDPNSIEEWCHEVRDRGYQEDIFVGVPGVIEMEKMISIARKVGVGESLGFIKKTTGIVDFTKSLLGSKGRYSPDPIVDHFESDASVHSGYHFYTFNRVEPTLEWVRESQLTQ